MSNDYKKFKFLKLLYKDVLKYIFFKINKHYIISKNYKNFCLNKNIKLGDKKYKIFTIKNAKVFIDSSEGRCFYIYKNFILPHISIDIKDITNSSNIFNYGITKFCKKFNFDVISIVSGRDAKDNYYHWLIDVLPRLIILEKEIKTFMKTKNLEDDAFMQKLVADVYVAYTGMDSHCGIAFIGARLTTQGNQRAYDINNFDALSNATDAIFGSRSNNSFRQCTAPELGKGQQDGFSMIAPTNLRQASCYTTPTQAKVMRVCSQQPMDDSNNN